MTLYVWKLSYELGVPEIDMQHRQLVGMINELFDAMKEGRGHVIFSSLLERVVQYVQLHFTTEEQIMRGHDYPGLSEHVEQHRDFTNQVLQLKLMHQKGAEGEALGLMTLLSNWLRDHITVSDKEFGKYLKKCKALEAG